MDAFQVKSNGIWRSRTQAHGYVGGHSRRLFYRLTAMGARRGRSGKVRSFLWQPQPKQKNVDFSLGKMFRLHEGQSLRFLADFFNLFNHPSFANPAFAAVGPTPGSGSAPITSTIGTPRLIQFSLKYSF
jgi:hypothetical protein